MADGQQLNSLDRFRKRPARLVLEEHSSCEVPAGCGGVVLRWRNPLAALPITIYVYTPQAAVSSIDGTALATGRVDLRPGRHVLTVVLEKADLSVGLLMVAATHEPERYQPLLPAELVEPTVKIVSEDDATWKFTLIPPASEEWQTLPFADQDWPALVRVTTPQLTWEDYGRYACNRCQEQGTVCLGLPGRGPEDACNIWIRKVFEIPTPQLPTGLEDE